MVLKHKFQQVPDRGTRDGKVLGVSENEAFVIKLSMGEDLEERVPP